MKTLAVRLYGENDLRLDLVELPKINDDEILAKIVTDSICMSTYKAVIQGENHKRVPKNIKTNPVMVGHEFCGEILEVGSKWKDKYKAGDRFVIQPALNYNGSLFAPGYSYEYIGGASQIVILPKEIMETDNLIKYDGDAFFKGSLTEPMSCIVGAFNANYHTVNNSHSHIMGCKKNGKMLILAGCGPMGIGAIDYALNGTDTPPCKLVVTDIDEERIELVKEIYGKDDRLTVINSCDKEELLNLSDGTGYDDIFVFAPVKGLIEIADSLLAMDGCLNFFAGPTDTDFTASLNFYNVHYTSTHIVGTSGGNCEDLKKSAMLISNGKINPCVMITHIGGLDSVIDTTLNLPQINGGKKLIYTDISLPLTKISDFERLSQEKDNENAGLFAELSVICQRHGGLWNAEAEIYLINNGKRIGG